MEPDRVVLIVVDQLVEDLLFVLAKFIRVHLVLDFLADELQRFIVLLLLGKLLLLIIEFFVMSSEKLEFLGFLYPFVDENRFCGFYRSKILQGRKKATDKYVCILPRRILMLYNYITTIFIPGPNLEDELRI